MAVQTKNKLNIVAKALGMQSKELVAFYAEHGVPGKTTMAALSSDEMSMILEYVLSKHVVDDVTPYLVAPKKKPASAEVKEAPEKPKQEDVKKVQTPKKPETPQKAEAPKKPETELPQKQAPAIKKTEQKPNAQREDFKRFEEKKFEDRNRQPSQRPDNRPDSRQDRRPSAKPAPYRPAKEPVVNNNTKVRVPTSQQQNKPKGQGAVKAKTGEVRIVDTRTTSVDLSKYDERLDKYIPEKSDKLIVENRQKIKKNNRDKNFDKERLAMEKIKKAELEKARNQPLTVHIPPEIVVSEFAQRMKITASEIVKKLMMLGVMVSLNQTIDFDTAALVAEDLGAKVVKEVVVTIEEKLIDETDDKEEDLKPRPPVLVVMGHVDHGKTSLLDAIRKTSVTKGEAGGITQHIGAYSVDIDGKKVTFLDTPGHEAFTTMRARGAKATDIAILVVAADDGIMPQTVEAINHAKAANIPIIVAINKMDKPTANPDKIKQDLTNYELVPEEWGGDTICVPISALTGQGIPELLEMALLVADMKELKANPDREAKGIVIEAKLDKGKGPVATVLVQNGSLKQSDIVIVGTTVGRIRVMTNDMGKTVKIAGPSTPVEIVGLSEVPNAGDILNVVKDERMARELADQRRTKLKEEAFNANQKASLDDLFAQGAKELNIIVKADVQGSVEAVKAALVKLSNEEIKVNVIHGAVGGVKESDVTLADASNAIIVGFNVRPDKIAVDMAKEAKVDIRTYRVIYDCIEEITAAMKGMLAPKFKEVILGRAEVRQTIHVPKVGTIAGCYITDGKVTRNSSIRVLRDSVVIFEDSVSSLKRFKDDAKEVMSGYECGIGLEKFNDIHENDVLEAFIMEEVQQ